ncbi:type I toxin-antitoxin system Fst family toxin [Staphylococcus capitis]|nr:type I toxin-antitoxin system Fst family toxin [Staphylococcus capitis]
MPIKNFIKKRPLTKVSGLIVTLFAHWLRNQSVS